MRPSCRPAGLALLSLAQAARTRFLDDELELIADGELRVALEADAALQTLLDFLDVVLESLETGDLALEDHRVIARDLDEPAADHLALADARAGDVAVLDGEDLLDLA